MTAVAVLGAGLVSSFVVGTEGTGSNEGRFLINFCPDRPIFIDELSSLSETAATAVDGRNIGVDVDTVKNKTVAN